MNMKTLAIVAITISALTVIFNAVTIVNIKQATNETPLMHQTEVATTTNDGYKIITIVQTYGEMSKEQKETIVQTTKDLTAPYDPNISGERDKISSGIGSSLETNHIPVYSVSIWHKRVLTTCNKFGCSTTPLKGE